MMNSTEHSPGNFDEPWQAQAFALTLQLTRCQAFSWTQWVDQFSTTIAESPQRPDEGVAAAYYRQWMEALETIVACRGLANAREMKERAAQWRSAYLHTPHGQPVRLENALQPPLTFSTHETRIRPIAVSPARHST